jgi:hypothetical protein
MYMTGTAFTIAGFIALRASDAISICLLGYWVRCYIGMTEERSRLLPRVSRRGPRATPFRRLASQTTRRTAPPGKDHKPEAGRAPPCKYFHAWLPNAADQQGGPVWVRRAQVRAALSTLVIPLLPTCLQPLAALHVAQRVSVAGNILHHGLRVGHRDPAVRLVEGPVGGHPHEPVLGETGACVVGEDAGNGAPTLGAGPAEVRRRGFRREGAGVVQSALGGVTTRRKTGRVTRRPPYVRPEDPSRIP